jgi:hypothetical protein
MSVDQGKEVAQGSSRFLGHGMSLAVSVAIFGWLGSEIGERVGLESLLTLFGMLLGGTVGFYNLYVQSVLRPRQDQYCEESDKD